MVMYAISILPLILWFEHYANQIWCADCSEKIGPRTNIFTEKIGPRTNFFRTKNSSDSSSAGGNIKSLKKWWDELQKLGLSFGYLINSTKSLLVVKEHCLEETQSIFEDTGIQVRVANSAVAFITNSRYCH